jgi:hypothetical protein
MRKQNKHRTKEAMKQTTMIAIKIACLAFGASAALGAETPKSWFRAGSHPREYDMSIDRDTVRSGKGSATLKSVAAKTSGFGTLMQTFRADSFHGKRVRMSGYVRSKEVGEWAGLWMRVDGPQNEALAFDNMQDRPVKSTTDWAKYDIVLDVPQQAQEISFGLLLTGRGQVWMDDLKFEAVGQDVPTTGGKTAGQKPLTASNLNFEE